MSFLRFAMSEKRRRTDIFCYTLPLASFEQASLVFFFFCCCCFCLMLAGSCCAAHSRDCVGVRVFFFFFSLEVQSSSGNSCFTSFSPFLRLFFFFFLSRSLLSTVLKSTKNVHLYRSCTLVCPRRGSLRTSTFCGVSPLAPLSLFSFYLPSALAHDARKSRCLS